MKTTKEIQIKIKRVPLAKEDQAQYHALSHPAQAAATVRALLRETDQEAFVAVPLDAKNKPMGAHKVALGSPDACPVDLRMVFRAAIVMGATSLIVAHNHPSGDTKPSQEDKALTRRLVEAGALLGLLVLDHLIVTEENHVSLREACPSLWS